MPKGLSRLAKAKAMWNLEMKHTQGGYHCTPFKGSLGAAARARILTLRRTHFRTAKEAYRIAAANERHHAANVKRLTKGRKRSKMSAEERRSRANMRAKMRRDLKAGKVIQTYPPGMILD